MNKELIDKLYQQAREKCAEKNDGLIHFYGIRDELVELIVQECADLCDRFQARDVGMQPAECAGAIRNMFGVER
jgi:hypothetical protein